MRKLVLVFIYLVALAGQNYVQGQSQENVTKALIVRHIPNLVEVHSTPQSSKESDMYKWQFRTEVKNNLDVPLRITHFEFWFYEHGKWVPRNIKKRTLTSTDFTQWYSDGDLVVDGWIQPGKIAVDSRNWVTYTHPVPPRSKWTYTAEDSAGNKYHAESEVELIPFVKPQEPWAEIDRSRLVPIYGKVFVENDQPPTYAQIRLNNFTGNYQEPLQTVVAGEDGTFFLQAAKPGLYRLFIFAVGHERLLLPLILDAETREINIDLKLAPLNYEEKLDIVKIFGDWNSFNSKDADNMQKMLDGTFTYERHVQSDTMAYQLLGITITHRNIHIKHLKGTQADYYVQDSRGHYVSVLKVKPGLVKIVFEPQKLIRAADENFPGVIFGEPNVRHQKVWDIDRTVQKDQEAYRSAIEAYRETHDDMRDFKFDWSETVTKLKKQMHEASDLLVRQYAAIQLGQLPTRPNDIDSETILEILELLPPNSELWSAAPYLPSRFAYQYGRAMEERFLRDFAESNPDRIVRAMSLAQLATRAHFGNDKETAARYYEKLKTEYGDVKEIQHQLMRLNPDKRIIVGKPVPDFEVKLMDNDETISNKTLLGTFYLIDFWAVWCAPCVQEMENLHAVYEKFKDRNFSILSISFDQKSEDAVKFRKEKWRMPWLNAFLEDGFRSELAKKFEVVGIPKSILVGPNGLILDEGSTLRGEALDRTLSRNLEGSN